MRKARHDMLLLRIRQFLSCFGFLITSIAGLCSSLPVVAVAQSSIPPRISGPIEESSVTVLGGNVPANARPEFDQGEAPSATQLASMRLVLSHSAEQQAAMDALMAQQLQRSSPNYHRWLTPDQFGRLYGPADSDIAAIVAWLESHGLKVEDIPPGRNNITFSGTVSQVEEAFHVAIHSFEVNGECFLSNTADPSIPSALASVISGVAQLNTIRPRPHSVPGRAGQFDPDSHRLVPAAESSTVTRPELTTGSAGSYNLYLVPSDAATIYDTPNSFNANFASGGTSYTGSGVTIGVVGDALIQASTVVAYRSRFLNDSTAPTINNVSPLATAGTDTDEAYLDVEIAGGLAPGAGITFYTSNSLQTAIQQAITDNKVGILSVSFGECELSLGTAGNQLLDGWWQQASMAGIAVVVSSGDSGSAACDSNTSESAAIHGLQVSGFASTPYNIAVGGTDYSSLVAGFTTYVNTTNSSAAATPYLSAKGYIPESVWNDSSISDTMLTNNVPAQNPLKNNATNIIAGGGGFSSCSTNSTSGNTPGTCTSGYAKPSWQLGAGVPGDGARDIPDVSLFAGNGIDGAAWLVCTDDAATGGAAGQSDNCVANSNNPPTFAFAAFGGTSTAAPAFAGILALVQQKAGGRLGLAAQELYNLFNSSKAGVVFHDVTTGNNSVVCTSGSTSDCQKNGAGYFFLTGNDTTAGYDLATGVGSVDATQLVTYWGSVTGSAAATIALTPSATTITAIQSLTVNTTVAGSGNAGTPTGTITLSDGGNYSSSATLASGAASFTIPAGALQPGTVTLTANYSGDVNYAKTSNSVSVTVSALAYTLAATTPGAVTPGNLTSSSVTVSTSNGYSGSVAVACAVSNTPANAVDVPSCGVTGSPVTLSSTATSGTVTLTFTTTAPVATLTHPRGRWEDAGVAVLALLVFFGIPSRRRSWRPLVGLVAAAFVLLSVSSCGSSSGSGSSNPGTTAGKYTYIVTGTGTPAPNSTPTTTVTLTVN